MRILSAGAVPLLAAVWKDHTGNARYDAHCALDELGYNDDGPKKKCPLLYFSYKSFPFLFLVFFFSILSSKLILFIVQFTFLDSNYEINL